MTITSAATAPRLVGGTGNPTLVAAVARVLGTAAEERLVERFPDGELHVVLGRSQRREHVFIVQPTGPPVDEHLVELVMLADACRRAGAARVTAVVPYFGYSRQDRRSMPGEAIGAKAVAHLIEAAGIDQLVSVDPHSAALEFVCSTCFLIKPNRTDPSSRDLEMTMHDEAVRSLVKQPPIVVYPESTLRAVAQTLSEEWIGAVVVQGTRPPGAPGSRAEGVVSERDIVQALADGLDPDTTRAQDVMMLDLACAAPDESVLEVAARMLDNGSATCR